MLYRGQRADALLDELPRSGETIAREPGGDGDDPQRFAKVRCPPRRTKSPRCDAGLHDDHCIGQRDEDAVSSREAGAKAVSGGEGPQHRARSTADGLEELGVRLRKAAVAARARYHPGATVRLERASMRGSVDPDRSARYDDHASPRQRSGQRLREGCALRVGLAASPPRRRRDRPRAVLPAL